MQQVKGSIYETFQMPTIKRTRTRSRGDGDGEGGGECEGEMVGKETIYPSSKHLQICRVPFVFNINLNTVHKQAVSKIYKLCFTFRSN